MKKAGIEDAVICRRYIWYVDEDVIGHPALFFY